LAKFVYPKIHLTSMEHFYLTNLEVFEAFSIADLLHQGQKSLKNLKNNIENY